MVLNRRFGWRSGSVNARDLTLKGNASLDSIEVLVDADAGGISLYKSVTLFDITGSSDIDFTLANGKEGQIKILKITTATTNDAVLTPANLHDGTRITFGAANQSAILQYSEDNGWMVISITGAVVS
jgi:hypothetical protein